MGNGEQGVAGGVGVRDEVRQEEGRKIDGEFANGGGGAMGSWECRARDQETGVPIEGLEEVAGEASKCN